MQVDLINSCTAILCAANEYVSSNTCIACAAGKTNAADNDLAVDRYFMYSNIMCC